MPRRPILQQTWANIVWCHWPVPESAVRAILPPGLSPDLFEGEAWVGLIPFSMQRLRPPGPLGFLTALVGSANFGEVNVRTYVVGPDGRRGVWFCTLDADSMAAVATANLAFGLPYRVASTTFEQNGTQWRWRSRRRRDGCQAAVEVIVNDGASRRSAPGLETFLFERYALYTSWRGCLLRGELWHEPWRIRGASLTSVSTETVAQAGFLVSGAPHVFVGEPVDVSVFPMRRVGRTVRRRHS